MKVLSLGWGIQSFTLASMVAIGELEPIDVAIHSDTGYESKLTYEFAERWTEWLESHGVHVETVHGTDGTTDQIFNTSKSGYRFLKIPAFYTQDGKRSIMRRQCTTHWKIRPVRHWITKNRSKRKVEQWIGISLDERERMRISDVKFLTNRFPLVEKRMTRDMCIAWLENHGLEVPPKSACIFCPYHSEAQWAKTKSVTDDWKRAIEVDELVRNFELDKEIYLNSQLKPLAELDLDLQNENDRMEFFDCSGNCWL
jgi:hypothetical protein